MKFIFIFFCIFLLIRFLFKPLLKLIIQMVVGKMVNQQGSFQSTYTNQKRRPQGSVDVDFVPPQNKKKQGPAPGSGEYIDYEEVK